MTFKAYVSVVMNKLTYVSSGEVGSFVAVLLQIYLSISELKIIEI